MTRKLRPHIRPGGPATPSSDDGRSAAGSGTSMSLGGVQTTVLPIRPKDSLTRASVDVYNLPSHGGVLVKVQPPGQPDCTLSAADLQRPAAPGHVPCSIALVIDVSGSMQTEAPVPDEKDSPEERNGLTVLDLVKHAARTILETLNEHDRLGIVAFSDDAEVLLALTPMTAANKANAHKIIQKLKPLTMTNLWKGLTASIELFSSVPDSACVPSIMLLTDGLPNYAQVDLLFILTDTRWYSSTLELTDLHRHPPQGYIPKLRTFGKLPAPIHTFGFGYNLRSGLLKSISEFTGGNYAFIPDAGMLGTVFIHAVANMQSTFAANATLILNYPASIQLEQALGTVVGETQPVDLVDSRQLTLPLGSIQYGQSRDVFLRYAWNEQPKPEHGLQAPALLRVRLEYHQMSPDACFCAAAQCTIVDGDPIQRVNSESKLSDAEAAFHVARSDFCASISSLFPLTDEDEHNAVGHDNPLISNTIYDWEAITAAATLSGNQAYTALMRDIRGQALMAIRTSANYRKWGRHYLLSLQSAHVSQQCNSFKDPGPLLYGASSRLFLQCRDALDKAFDNLPAPKPSGCAVSMAPINMGKYRNVRGACFASFCRVTLADRHQVRVNRLRRGMQVLTPRGPRTVAAVLKTPVAGAPMVSVGGLVVTPWHPISHNGKDWVFPCQDREVRRRPRIRYTGAIYSVLLQPDEDVDAHALRVEGSWVVTLGHGLTEKIEGAKEDVRVHSVFGNYAGVCQALAYLEMRKDGVLLNVSR